MDQAAVGAAAAGGVAAEAAAAVVAASEDSAAAAISAAAVRAVVGEELSRRMGVMISDELIAPRLRLLICIFVISHFTDSGRQ